eukprot:TRINITY_DN3173_c0_g1_i5.p2 TRINITY_DN3173_c0_g1~~TRINITY_DN3173_c0_g1_i5.p2  ORF type:complete len:106 (-),score=8.11 TRINITY_DN3173_c0_g1_i5:150-467(-)
MVQMYSQVLSYHFHSKAVEEIFQINTEAYSHPILQISYSPKQRTNIGYWHFPLNITDLLIDVCPAFKQVVYVTSLHEYTWIFFSDENKLVETPKKKKKKKKSTLR